jgi:hypothetical protein
LSSTIHKCLVLQDAKKARNQDIASQKQVKSKSKASQKQVKNKSKTSQKQVIKNKRLVGGIAGKVKGTVVKICRNTKIFRRSRTGGTPIDDSKTKTTVEKVEKVEETLKTLNTVLKNHTTSPNDDWYDTSTYDERTNSSVLKEFGLLEWYGWDCYAYDFTSYNPIPLETFKQMNDELLDPLLLKSEDKICGLYGVDIHYTVSHKEPHAFLIFKNVQETKWKIFNGRGQIMVNGNDICEQHINKMFGNSDDYCVYKQDTPLQSKLDGFSVKEDGTVTKTKDYKGLCLPVAVLYSYLFLKTPPCITFEMVDQYIQTLDDRTVTNILYAVNEWLIAGAK